MAQIKGFKALIKPKQKKKLINKRSFRLDTDEENLDIKGKKSNSNSAILTAKDDQEKVLQERSDHEDQGS